MLGITSKAVMIFSSYLLLAPIPPWAVFSKCLRFSGTGSSGTGSHFERCATASRSSSKTCSIDWVESDFVFLRVMEFTSTLTLPQSSVLTTCSLWARNISRGDKEFEQCWFGHHLTTRGIDEDLLAEAQQVVDVAQCNGLAEKPEVLKERLFNAVNDGELSVAKACLDANAETPVRLPVDVVDEDGNTPLSEAACYGEVELVGFFLSRGAHPDSRNELGRTPIWRACYNGHFEIVKLLLENGADKSIASNTGEEPGKQLEKN